MAQIMVFCFFFGKGCSQFFQTSFCWWQQKNIKVHPPKKTNWTFSFSRCNVVTFLLQQHGGGAHLFKDVGKGKGITATSPEPGNVTSENTTIHGFVGWLVGCYVVGSWWLVVVACWSFRVKPNWDLFEKHSLFLFERTFWKSSSPKKGVDLTMEYSVRNQSTFSESKTSNQVIHLDPPLLAGFWKKQILYILKQMRPLCPWKLMLGRLIGMLFVSGINILFVSGRGTYFYGGDFCMVHESDTKTNPSPSGQPGDLGSPRKNPNHLVNPCWSFERLKGVEVTLKCPTFFKIPSLTASLPLQKWWDWKTILSLSDGNISGASC